jgi:hypothetical protein
LQPSEASPHFIFSIPLEIVVNESHREEIGEKGNSLELSALPAGAYTTTFLVMVTLSTPLLLCPSKIF